MYYDKAENFASMISSLYLRSVSIIIVPPPVVALIITLWKVLIQDMKIGEIYLLPVYCSMPFELNNWSKYICAYIWVSICYVFMVSMKMYLGMIQFNVNFYVIAYLKTLQSDVEKL